MNVLINIVILFLSILSIYLFHKYLDKMGLTIIFITMNITTFLLAFKYITLSTINANSNCITYVSMLTALYLLLESTSKKESKEIINMNFIVNIFIAIMLYIMTYYTQSITDTISVNMKNIYLNNYKILIFYPLITLLIHYLLIWIYEKIKKIYDNHFITTVTIYLFIGIIESILYNMLIYSSILNTKTIILLILSTYMIRIITTVIYSLFLPLFTKKKVIS